MHGIWLCNDYFISCLYFGIWKSRRGRGSDLEYLNVISLKLQRITAETDFTCIQTMDSLWL